MLQNCKTKQQTSSIELTAAVTCRCNEQFDSCDEMSAIVKLKIGWKTKDTDRDDGRLTG